MNKFTKKFIRILFLTFFCLLIFCISKSVKANSISKISMDIFVDDEGNASVTEVWNCNVNNGTESYHPYYNLGNSKITNLTVAEGDKVYTTLNSWNTSGTLSSKAYKCGIHKISNGVELCWGISNYGSHNYVVKYNISNFIATLNDCQMIYWTLIPYDFSTSIGSVYIKIHTNFNIADTIDVWGYGDYGAPAYVYNGYIEMESNGRLDTSEYMTILVKFPQGSFNNVNKINRDFDDYYNMAQEGAVKYNHSSSNMSTSSKIEKIFMTIIGIFIGLFRIIVYVFIVLVIFLAGKREKFNFGEKGKNFSKDTPYYRDIPCNGNLYKAYYIAHKYGIIKKKTDILGAIILKWLKEGKIRIEQKQKGKVFKREDTIIILKETNQSEIADTYEKQLFKMLYEASIDGILENKEFEKWCNKSYSKILSWFDSIISSQQKILVSEGLITVEETKTMGIFKKKTYTMTPEIRKEAEEIYGLTRYLLEYTLIPERQAIEVKLFEEYLVYAQMLGIAKEVAKEFKDLYPDIIEQSHFNSYDNIIFIHAYSTRAISAAYSAKTRAESYSSGGGGFSSGGGGGGSFGGGGGGRRFPLKIL